MRKIVLKDEIRPENVNWLIGHFLPKNSSRFSKQVEVAFANRTRVRDNETLHHHEKSTEIYICLEGSITLIVDSGKYQLGPKELIVVQPKIKHQITKIASKSQYLTIKAPSLRGDKLQGS